MGWGGGGSAATSECRSPAGKKIKALEGAYSPGKKKPAKAQQAKAQLVMVKELYVFTTSKQQQGVGERK